VHEYPDDISVYLIAVSNTRLELEISDVVREAGTKVTDLILTEIGVEVSI
jgi:hypothetical protein